MKIVENILKAIDSDLAFTDIGLRAGLPVLFRTPTGYRSLDDGYIIAQEDIVEFATFAAGDWVKRVAEGEGQFDVGVTIKGRVRLRCNFYQYGIDNLIGVIVRKLPVRPMSIDQIGTSPTIKRLIDSMPKGLLLVSGPTGSGKSTTLASFIDYYNNTQPVSIITLEEPIEYEFERNKAVIIQREVPHNVISFERGVQTAKRQDPDVIMVGEVRDKGTVDAVITAACSGHLVLATTHARSVQESCEAILSYYAGEELRQKRALLASSLLAVTSQVLLSSADGKSFVMAYEVMHNSPQIAMMIREGKMQEIAAMMARATTTDPMVVSLNARLAKLVAEGRITVKEALAGAYDKEQLARVLK